MYETSESERRSTARHCIQLRLTMDKKSNSSWDLPTDALVEILARLPPNARRRFRLVCRLWRELIDQHKATDMQRRTKIVAVTHQGVQCVVDVLTPGFWAPNLWHGLKNAAVLRYCAMSIVGICNGLVCLCDYLKPAGAITVVNPLTREALHLPPLPLPMPGATAHLNNNNTSWHQRYNFAYHPATRRYKVVHVPCHSDQFWQPDMLHVFTLGEASWREVQVDTHARCRLGRNSLTDVDGTVYWLTDDARKIMSFDLKHERVARTEPLPVTVMPSTCHLTKVHGRLGVAIGDDDTMTVWVLEGERWIHRYVWEAHRVSQQEKWLRREVVMPHFVLGDYFLTLTHASSGEHFLLYRHTMSKAARSQDGVVQIRHKDWSESELVAWFTHPICQVFSYIETKEPLSVYNAGLVRN